MKKNAVITCIKDVAKYNLGNAMCYFGIVISAAGAIAAFAGNKIRLGSYHSDYIIGPDTLTADFIEIINDLKAKKP